MKLFNAIEIRKLSKPPIDVPAEVAKTLMDPQKKKDAVRRLFQMGTTFSKEQLGKVVNETLATSYWRRTFYRECEQASSHAYVSGAMDLYVDTVCAPSAVNNKSVWVVSNDKKIENVANQFLEEICIEERIRDWAGQLAMYGDHFVEGIAREGIGIAFVDDNIHPADMERIDVNGRLEGFLRTGLYSNQTQFTAEMEPPWKYVHMRLFGVTRKALNTALGIFGEPGRMFSLEKERLGDKRFRITTKYGISLLFPSIPIYKRLKLAEDSLLLARITRGMIWYLYKIKIAGGTMDQANEIIQGYAEFLKRSAGMNLSEEQQNQQWKDRWAPIFAQVEDVFVPETEDISLSFDKMGGEVDIKAIVDVELLVNQLLGSLRVSKSMLGITDELPGSFGQGAAARISINFAKNAQRLQAGMKMGIKRLIQIHLAYRGLNADPRRFDVQFAQISSAEEEEIKDALDKGADVCTKVLDMFEHIGVTEFEDKMDILAYLNDKILKLSDFDFAHLKNKITKKGPPPTPEEPRERVSLESVSSAGDCLGYLPCNKIYRVDESNTIKEENKIWTPMKVSFKKDGAK